MSWMSGKFDDTLQPHSQPICSPIPSHGSPETLYSNLGIALLGQAWEKVTASQQSWEEFVTESILKPLRMTNTSVNVSGVELALLSQDLGWSAPATQIKGLRPKQCLPLQMVLELVSMPLQVLIGDYKRVRTSVWLRLRFLIVILLVGQIPSTTLAQSTGLNSTKYYNSCQSLLSTALAALQSDGRVGALRLHFHNCLVQGCDASDLLNDTANFTGEKNARPNANLLRGFSAVDAIKSAVENVCPGVVLCADILALAARDVVVLAGGPSSTVEFGRLDGVTANQQTANNNLPSANSNVQSLTASFSNQGLSQLDMVALAGAS